MGAEQPNKHLSAPLWERLRACGVESRWECKSRSNEAISYLGLDNQPLLISSKGSMRPHVPAKSLKAKRFMPRVRMPICRLESCLAKNTPLMQNCLRIDT